MKNRLIKISIGLLITASCMMTFTGCKKKEPEITLLMSDVQEGEHPTAKSCDYFADLVEENTNGRIKIEVYHGNTLGTEAEQAQQVSVGGIDFARISSPITEYDENYKAFQALYLFQDEESMWKVLDGTLGEEFLTSDNLSKNGMEGLCWFSGGSRNFYNNVKEIKKPTDLAGLKIRVNTDSMFAFLEKVGAHGVNLAYGDIYSSLAAKSIDGAENNWPSYISTEHYKQASYITIDEHTRVPEIIVASKKTMDKLSESDQNIIRECARKASIYQREKMQEFEEKAIKEAEDAGCVITHLSEEEAEEFSAAADTVNQEISAAYIDIINRIKQEEKE